MGYACPVCGDPQADGEHLANHLAFTAMLGDDDHEAWLDDHAPEWADSDPAALAATVTDRAEEREFPRVFADTTGRDHSGRGPGAPADAAPGGMVDPADLADDDTEPSNVLAEARDLTRQRRAESGEFADENAADGDSDEDAAGDDED